MHAEYLGVKGQATYFQIVQQNTYIQRETKKYGTKLKIIELK